MSIFPGKKASSLIGQPLDERLFLSNLLQVADAHDYDSEKYVLGPSLAGDVRRDMPPDPVNKYTARLVGSVNTFFYQGVYFQQDAVIVNVTGYQVGLVLEDTIYTFELFSTASQKRTVESIGITDGAAGITVDNLAVGYEFYPYEEFSVDLAVVLDGPPAINTTFYIKFTEDPATYSLTLQGTRLEKFFVNDPNWIEDVSVSRRFLTSVFASQNMAETRKILRPAPVRSMQVSLVAPDKDRLRQAVAEIYRRADRSMAYPWYPDTTPHTQVPEPYRVYCETAFRRFQVGGYAFLVVNSIRTGVLSFEAVRISELFVDGFTTIDVIEGTYAIGDPVYPAFVCHASLDTEMVLHTSQVGEIVVTLEEIFGEAILDNENSEYSPVIRASLPVLDVEVTFTEEVSFSTMRGGRISEAARGVQQILKGVPFAAQSLTAISCNREECWNIIGFFNYLKGRGRPFWVRSEADTVDVVSSFLTESAIVKGSLGDFDFFRYVWITDSTGAFDIVEVLTMQTDPAGVELVFDTNGLADIVTIRQAFIVRLSSDVVEEEYLTDGVMLATFRVQELQGAY